MSTTQSTANRPAVYRPESNFAMFWAGFRGQGPLLIGVIPFGMIYGLTAINAGLPPAAAMGMSMFVFAGSAQFIAAQLFGLATPGLIIVITTFMVNLRHALYSASVAPYVSHLNKGWKYLLAFLLTDEAYAVTISHYRHLNPADVRGKNDHFFFLGAGVALWTFWQGATIVGIVVGAAVPASWSLDFTLALTFIALLIPTLEDRPTVLAGLVGGLAAVIGYNLPYNLGLVLAVVVGIGAGVLAERTMGSSEAAPVHEGSA